MVIGDDCVVIFDGDGYLFFVIEGMVSDFVCSMFWFVGYSGVMVNVSDIYVMGGCLFVVVDVLWSGSVHVVGEVFVGMVVVLEVYGVLVVGGYSNVCSDGV